MGLLDRRFRMCFYRASDGPRLMLFGPLEVDVRSLQMGLRVLRRDGAELELHSQPFVTAGAQFEIIARCSPTRITASHAAQRRSLVKLGHVPMRFEWTQSAYDWDCAAELLDPLAASDGPGHQYLTQTPSDDALVVVSKGEYSDEFLNR